MSDPNRRDADLAADVAQQDREAFDALFEEFAGPVRSIARRVLRDPTLAEDVVQETFVAFWNDPGRYDPSKGSLRTFLLSIAHKRAVDIVRSETARTRREQRPPDPVHIDVEEEALSRQLSETVRAALDELPENERQAITLAYFGGLSYVEVAARLGAPEGTVKSRIRSGMKRLSRSLATLAGHVA